MFFSFVSYSFFKGLRILCVCLCVRYPCHSACVNAGGQSRGPVLYRTTLSEAEALLLDAELSSPGLLAWKLASYHGHAAVLDLWCVQLFRVFWRLWSQVARLLWWLLFPAEPFSLALC